MMTPYAAAKFVNAKLEEAGLAKRIPAQMMYNYTTARVNAGKKPLIAFDIKKGVDQNDLERWTQAYVAKQTPVVEEEPVEA